MKFNRFISYIIDFFIGYLPVCMICCYITLFFVTIFNLDDSGFEALPFIYMLLYISPHYLIGMYIPELFSGGLNLIDTLSILGFVFAFIASKTAYYTLSEIFFKDTIGKRIVGVSLRDLNGFKTPIIKKILRNFLKSISEMIIIPYIIYLIKKDDKMFYDKICKTNVYDKSVIRDYSR